MTKKTKSEKPTIAFEEKSKDGCSIVGIGNLRVVIVQEEDSWFAQGLEIDYAAQGTDIKDVKKQFGDGLAATVREHLKIFGTIENLLKVAPQDVWKDMLLGVTGKRYCYSQVSVHNLGKELKESLPFDGIQYLNRTPIEFTSKSAA
jgi:hypothetical protein